MEIKKTSPITFQTLLPVLFFAGRLLLFLALIPNNLHGFGDFPIYFQVASLPGFPYIDTWSEYPPIFAWLIEFIFQVSSGNQFLFDFVLFLLLTLCGAVSIWLVSEIAKKVEIPKDQQLIVNLAYFGLIAFLAYSWWYFDFFPVMLMVWAIYLILINKNKTAGLVIAIGILTKWFPLLLLPAIFRYKKWKQALGVALLALGGTLLVWAIFYFVSPTMTKASLQSQPSRASWQTMWALIDGNLTTGEFIPLQERLWPEAAVFPRGNPAIISTWTSLVFFGLIGLNFLFKFTNKTPIGFLSMAGITWALFLLWSPGWSPQWTLYLLPIILLTLPPNKGWFISFLFLLLTLIEWPLLLKHGLWMGLWVIVPLRIAIFIYLIFCWQKRIPSQKNNLSL